MKVRVLIDGNNLAHEKYNLPNRDVPLEVVQKLVSRLSVWARTHKERCSVFLFLDPRYDYREHAENISILIADPKDNEFDADENIVKKVTEFARSNSACIVVTDDKPLRDRVAELNAKSISAGHFAQKSKTGEEFSLPWHLFHNDLLQHTPRAADKHQSKTKTGNTQTAPEALLPATFEKSLPLDVQQPNNAKPTGAQETGPSPEPAEPLKKIAVQINIEQWPAKEGIHFLIQSACPRHRQRLVNMDLDETLAPDKKLNEIFKLFLYLCRGEKDLLERGGSLMDQAKLLLLKKYPNPILLEDLEHSIKISAGLKSKLNKNNGKWVELTEVSIE
ncbi:MAG: NYN domain-containing protein [Chloroflexota bacterium]